MREQHILKISEIFWSAQGEGLRMGLPAVFIRLSGCSLRCPYCDTADSWNTGTFFSVDDIVCRVRELTAEFPCSQVVITGGEPLEQDISDLVRKLKQIGLFLAIETNGTCFQNIPADWWTVSPKDISGFFIRPELESLICEIKLIVNENLNSEKVTEFSRRFAGIPVFLQPQAGLDHCYSRTFALYSECQRRGTVGVRLGIQLHNAYSIP